MTEGHIELFKIGKVYFVKHRKIQGKIKNLTVKRTRTGKWFVIFVTDFTRKLEVPVSDKRVGIDVGIEHFAALSDGSFIDNPRFFETEQKNLAKRQKRHAKKPSRKTRKSLARIHERIGNKRTEFQHKTALDLIRKYKTLCVEDLEINSMIKKRWCNKQILDAAWAGFFKVLSDKAEYAGRTIIKVNPAYTSQTCSQCGTRTVHELKDRIFHCSCGHRESRDTNAAKNILVLGLPNETLGLPSDTLGIQNLTLEIQSSTLGPQSLTLGLQSLGKFEAKASS